MTVVQALACSAAVCLFFRPARAYRAACALVRARREQREHAAELERLWGPE